MHIDHQYIDALRSNDQRGIREIYQRYSAQALRWVTQHHGSPADAQDIFQEALMAVYEKALDPQFVLTCPLGALLHVIYSRKWIDRLRQKGRDAEVRIGGEMRYMENVDDDALIVAEEALAEQAREQRLGKAFSELTDLCRRLLALLSDGVRPPDAAIQMNLNSVDTLYRRKNACIQRWRTLYLEPGPTETQV